MGRKLSMHPKTNDLLNRIEAVYEKLRKSEQKVLDYLRCHPDKRLDCTITDFAKIVGVSETTISRTTRALKYSSFSDLKLSLAEGAKPTRSASNQLPNEIKQDDSLLAIGAKLSDLYAANCQGTHQQLDANMLDSSVKQLQNAENVILTGVGGSYSVCEEGANLFSTIGKNCTTYQDGYGQIVAAAGIKPSSMLIGISQSGTTQSLVSAVKLARENGAFTLAITSNPKSNLANEAECTLQTWKSNAKLVSFDDSIGCRVSQMYIISLLYLGLVNKGTEEIQEGLEATDIALNRYFRV